MPRLAHVLAALLVAAASAGAQLVADFSPSATDVATGESVTFTDLTSGFVVVQQWDFGDGRVVATNQPTIDHVYVETGVYTVSLQVTGFAGTDTEVKTDLITVSPASLSPSFTATPDTGTVLLDVQFTDTTSGVGAPTSWSWDFGDGSTSTSPNPLHTYTAPGTYDVTLEVSSGGESWSVTQTDAVVVDPAVFSPDFTAAPTSGTVPLDVAFSDATTGDPPTAWLWTFGDGDASTAQDPVHTYEAPGTYTVTLTAFVGQQAEAVTQTDLVVVDPVPLVADLSAAPTSGPVPLTVDFSDASTGTPPTSWLWDFGDGSTSTEQDPQHVYEFPGTYTVTLSVGYFDQVETVVAEGLVQVDHLATLNVPGDASTIQAAVDMAGPFTEILIAPGTWHEAVVLGAGPVTLRGTGGAAATILDASGTGLPVVRAASGALPGTTLRGLTLTGGSSANGGGLRLDANATVAVRECIVRDNESLGEGGGVWVSGNTGTRITLTDCMLSGNTAADDGGGLAVEQSFFFEFGQDQALLERCAIVDNTSGGFGGGLLSGTARECVLSGNAAVSGGGAAKTTVEHCLFVDNSATEVGGGLIDFAQSFTFFATQTLADCVFVDNVAGTSGGGASLSASASLASAVVVDRCVFAGNSAPFSDGLAAATSPGTTTVEHCTFVDDSLSASNALDVTNSIVRSSVGPLGSPTDITWSNIEGGWPGVGNFDADPLFVDAAADAFGLRPGSPCVDAGDPSASLDPDGTRADVGALPLTSIHDVGAPLYGSNGLPSLAVDSTLAPGDPLTLTIARGPSSGSATLVIGVAALSAPLKGGVLVPAPLDLVPGLPLDVDGDVALPGTWPAGLPVGTTVWLQAWCADAAGPKGFSSTNGVALVQP